MQEILIYHSHCKLKKRQSCFQRNPDRHYLKPLTPRLHKLLTWLNNLGYLDTAQIARFFYKPGSRKYAERQLRLLYDLGFINRLSVPFSRRWGKKAMLVGGTRTIHYFDAKGRQYLKKHNITPLRTLRCLPRSLLGLSNFEHTLAVNEFLLIAYHAAMQSSWQFEIVPSRRANERRGIQPDSIYRVCSSQTKMGMYCLVEIDRGTESVQKIKDKIARYQDYYASGAYFRQFQTTSCRILFVVSDCRFFSHRLPEDEVNWRRSIEQRCMMLNQWIMEVGNQHDLFWVAPLYALNNHTFFHEPVWRHELASVSLIGKG